MSILARDRSTGRQALIIGGGIAGPALAMFLKRAGIESAVYEGRPEPDNEAGTFLGLAPNGRDVLSTLGITDEINAVGVPTPEISFLNHKGKTLGTMSQPVMTVNRDSLNRVLREEAIRRGIPVEFGKRLIGVEQADRSAVVARFEDGSEAEGDFLVGCDGIHSRTRQSVRPDAPEPEYTGVISSGGHAQLPDVAPTSGVMRMTFGKEGFFAHQVLDSGETYWFDNLFEAAESEGGELEEIPDDRWRQKLLDLHRHDHAPIPEIIRCTQSRIVRYPIYEMPVLQSWYEERVCLAGDAAHAMGPHTGQGASMALEDALVLAKCLRDIGDVQRALATYQSARKERVEFVVKETRRTGNSKEPPGAFGRFTRDLVLPIFLKKGMRTFDSVYAHHIEWEEKVA